MPSTKKWLCSADTIPDKCGISVSPNVRVNGLCETSNENYIANRKSMQNNCPKDSRIVFRRESSRIKTFSTSTATEDPGYSNATSKIHLCFHKWPENSIYRAVDGILLCWKSAVKNESENDDGWRPNAWTYKWTDIRNQKQTIRHTRIAHVAPVSSYHAYLKARSCATLSTHNTKTSTRTGA